MKKNIKIAQIGTFDVENYGDLLFPVLLKKVFKDYTIDLFSPKGGKKPFEEDTIVYPLSKLDEMCNENNYDALIIGGGDLIRLDNQVAKTYKKSYDSALSLWLLPCVLGKKYNIPVIFNAPGVPYYFDLNQEKMIKTILKNVDYISVRDEESKKVLQRSGIKNINVVPDTILCIDEFITKEDNIKIKDELVYKKMIPKIDNYIVVQHNKSNINNNLYIKEINKLIKLITEKYKYNVLLLPIGYVHNDIDFLDKIYNKNNKKVFIVKKKLTPEEMLSVLSCSKGYVGTSMHGAVTSYVYKNPIMIINVKKLVKIGGILEQMNAKNNQIKNIYDICDVFEQHFFNSYNESTHNNIKQKINSHFLSMKKIIEKENVTYDYNYERDLLLTSFEELTKYDEKHYDFANIYFDYGEDFKEEQKITVPIVKKEKNEIEFIIPKNAINIRIDLIEGKYQRLDYFNVRINDNETKYNVLESLYTNNKYYFTTTDPKVIIPVDDDSDYKKAKVEFLGEILEYDNFDSFMKSIYSDFEKIENENYSLKYKINNKMKYKTKYLIKRIIKKIIKKN